MYVYTNLPCHLLLPPPKDFAQATALNIDNNNNYCVYASIMNVCMHCVHYVCMCVKNKRRKKFKIKLFVVCVTVLSKNSVLLPNFIVWTIVTGSVYNE